MKMQEKKESVKVAGAGDDKTQALLNPVEMFEQTLLRRPPIKKCCCCSVYCGVIYTAIGIILEAFWVFGISIARPKWEWDMSSATIASFALANMSRAVSFSASVVIIIVTCRSKHGTFTLCQWRDFQFMKGYFRVLCCLIILDIVEIVLKFFDVEAICNAPEVQESRNTSEGGMDADGCIIFSNVYDFCIELVVLALLCYASWATFSSYRYIKGLEKAPPGVPVLATTVVTGVQQTAADGSSAPADVEVRMAEIVHDDSAESTAAQNSDNSPV